jgi:hypothetical protein
MAPDAAGRIAGYGQVDRAWLAQAAVRWAAGNRAPAPVLVPLRDVAGRQPRHGTDVTLLVLIEVATATAPQRERQPLRRGRLRCWRDLRPAGASLACPLLSFAAAISRVPLLLPAYLRAVLLLVS